MIPSNPSPRSSSRSTTSSQPSNPPGVLAISSAMLANANQSQSGQSTTPGRRTIHSTQLRSQIASNAKLFDPLSPAASPRASKEEARLEPASRQSAVSAQDAASTDASPLDSPSKRSRGRRRAKAPQSASDSDEGSEAPFQLEASAAVTPSLPSADASRPRQDRGLSSVNLSLTSNKKTLVHNETSDYTAEASEATTLSKSAPASSFLDTLQQSKRPRNKQAHSNSNSNPQRQDNNSNPNIRSSNSADEWDMPSARLLAGNDSLTWQQQAALSRKSSQGKKASNNKIISDISQYRKQPPTTVQQASPASATTPRSGLSNAMAAGAHGEQPPVQSALTWQQAQLQRSAPATPSGGNLFEALEDGYSGARPAADHSRTRSSPVKNSRPFTRSQQQQILSKPLLADETENNLDRQLKDLVLSSVKTVKAPPPRSAKKSKPIALKSSAPFGQNVVDHAKTAPLPAPDMSPSTTKPIPISATSNSPTKSALYAGPKFHNSPHAGQLPTPRLAALINRNRASSPAGQSPSSTEAIFA